MRQTYVSAPVLWVLIMLVSNLAQADQIFKSIDARGMVTYSSYPPGDAVYTERINISYENQSGNYKVADESLDQFRDIAEKLATDRKQREDEREAAQKQLQEAAGESQAAYQSEPFIYHYYPVYIIQRHHRHHKKPRKHRRRHIQHHQQPMHHPPERRMMPLPSAESAQYFN